MKMRFEGVLFTLKKRMHVIEIDDRNFYKYGVFGYYDGLDINMVEKWYDLRPKGLQDRGLQVDSQTPFVDQYTIRAIVPVEKEELEIKGFAYEFWKKVGMMSASEFCTSLNHKAAFITMSVISLTREYIAEKKDRKQINEGFFMSLEECVFESGYSLDKLYCAVYPSIGYSDYIVLFLIHDLKITSDIIGRLKEKVTSNDNIIVSNSYSVCGFDDNYICEKQSGSNRSDDFQNIEMTVRINIKRGISNEFFRQSFKEECDKIINEIENDKKREDVIELTNELYLSYFSTFGTSDCLMISSMVSSDAYFYVLKKIFNPMTDLFKKYIVNIHTSVRTKGATCFENQKDNNDKLTYNDDSCMLIYDLNDRFCQFIQEYERFLYDNNFHIRTAKALQKIMKNYENIVKTGHGFDVEYILGKGWDTLIDTTSICIRNEYEYSENVVDALNLFREYIGGFVSDLLRSDRPFIEGNVLTHPSIASATKILFAYNSILEKITAQFNEQDNFTFVVVSGGCDQTESIDFFSFAGTGEKIRKLILITIPEMSLYDVQGTLFRILHESMHFIGERRRKKRYEYMVEALAGMLVQNLLREEFTKENLEKLLPDISDYDLNDEEDNITDKIRKYYSFLREEAEKNITDLLKKSCLFSYTSEEIDEEDEEKYYMNSIMEGVFSYEYFVQRLKNGQGKINQYIYTILFNQYKNLIQFVYGELKSMYQTKKTNNDRNAEKIKFIISSFQTLLFKMQYLEENTNEKDILLKELIDDYFIGLTDFYASGEELKGQERIRYSDLTHIISTTMVECFCDCIAIKTLNVKPEDFILAFVYELWDVEKAFPNTIENILRIGADLVVSYNIQAIEEGLGNAIKNKIQLREKQGYVYREVDQIINCVDSILQEYKAPVYKCVRENLEKYLRLCVSAENEWYIRELSSLYEMCDMNNGDQIYYVIDYIIKYWSELGVGRD